jgi:hypothetical protein
MPVRIPPTLISDIAPIFLIAVIRTVLNTVRPPGVYDQP